MNPDFDPLAEASRRWGERYDAVAPMTAVTSIVRVQQLLVARLNALLAPLGLTFARYEALQLLAFSRRGALPLGKIGERLMVHPTSVTSTVDRLEADGLVRRTADPDDRRLTLAQLTDEGRQVCARATKVLVEERFGLDGLTDVDAEALTRQLGRVRSCLGDHVEPAAPVSDGLGTRKTDNR